MPQMPEAIQIRAMLCSRLRLQTNEKEGNEMKLARNAKISGVVLTIRFPEPMTVKMAEIAIPLIVAKNAGKIVESSEIIEDE